MDELPEAPEECSTETTIKPLEPYIEVGLPVPGFTASTKASKYFEATVDVYFAYGMGEIIDKTPGSMCFSSTVAEVA